MSPQNVAVAYQTIDSLDPPRNFTCLNWSTSRQKREALPWHLTFHLPRWQKAKNSTEPQKNTQKHVFWGLTKNTEKHFYHLGYRGWPKNTQKYVFWGLAKNTEKHFYHLGSPHCDSLGSRNGNPPSLLLNRTTLPLDAAYSPARRSGLSRLQIVPCS